MNNFKKILLSLLFISINSNCDFAMYDENGVYNKNYWNTQDSDLNSNLTFKEFLKYKDNYGNKKEYKKYKNEEKMLKERGDKKFLHHVLSSIYHYSLSIMNNDELERQKDDFKKNFFEDFKRQYARLNNIEYEKLNDDNYYLSYFYIILIKMPYKKIIYFVDELRDVNIKLKFSDIEKSINNQIDYIFNKIQEIRDVCE